MLPNARCFQMFWVYLVRLLVHLTDAFTSIGEFPNRLQIWKSPGHMRFHNRKGFYGLKGYFHIDITENLIQAVLQLVHCTSKLTPLILWMTTTKAKECLPGTFKPRGFTFSCLWSAHAITRFRLGIMEEPF